MSLPLKKRKAFIKDHLSYLPGWRVIKPDLILRHNGILAQTMWFDWSGDNYYLPYTHLVMMGCPYITSMRCSNGTEGTLLEANVKRDRWKHHIIRSYEHEEQFFRDIPGYKRSLIYSPDKAIDPESVFSTSARYEARYTLRGNLFYPLFYCYHTPPQVNVKHSYAMTYLAAYLDKPRWMNWWIGRFLKWFENGTLAHMEERREELYELKEWVKDGTAKERLEAQAAQTIEELNLGPPEDPSLFS